MSWREQAMCRGYDPDLFFPRFQRKGNNGRRVAEFAEHVAQAKRVCAMCPVDLECLDYALQLGQRTFHKDNNCFWGGTTYQERLHITETNVA